MKRRLASVFTLSLRCAGGFPTSLSRPKYSLFVRLFFVSQGVRYAVSIARRVVVRVSKDDHTCVEQNEISRRGSNAFRGFYCKLEGKH